MLAAVACGTYETLLDAMDKMAQKSFGKVYTPSPDRQAYHARRFAVYKKLGAFTEASSTIDKIQIKKSLRKSVVSDASEPLDPAKKEEEVRMSTASADSAS